MTVGELQALLAHFPPSFPAFVRPGPDETVVPAEDAVMELVHPVRGVVLPDEYTGQIPDGFVDAVVLYSRPVRDDL